MIVELGQMLEDEGYDDVKIYGPETMTSHNSDIANPMYIKVLTEGPAAEYLDVFATHGYVDGFQEEYGSTSLIEFREMIENTGKPFWITEGGTGGHKWPEPLTGIAAAIHNAAVHGHVEAFTPWQITDPHPSSHGMMVYDQPTPKTYAAQHFFHFIDAGAVRISALPTGKEVNISAFLHPEGNDLTVVMINPGENEKRIELELQGSNTNISNLKGYRTSETERMHPVNDFEINDRKIELVMIPQSIVTLKGKLEE